jgi:endonuclease/exonuclease/phosphatase family metal-dependent hydrolase
MSYNVHRCIGCDGVLSPHRIAEVIAHYQPDVVGLQELDVGHARTGHADQPEILARELEMHYDFFPAVEAANERYGDAILSRWPLRTIRAASLPTLSNRPRLERRGALWAAVECHGSGDFNAWPGTIVHRRLRRELANAQEFQSWFRWRKTYPARRPLVSIDHVFLSRDLAVASVDVPRTRLTKVASDHLPVIVDIRLA